MNFPEVKPWNENKLSESEKMIVLRPFRFNKDGKILKMKPGQEITLSGQLKKDLYHQLKVCYPQNFEVLKAYYDAQRKEGLASERAIPSTVAKAVDVDELKGRNAALAKDNEALRNQLNELSAKVDSLAAAADTKAEDKSEGKETKGGKK